METESHAVLNPVVRVVRCLFQSNLRSGNNPSADVSQSDTSV